MSSTKFAQPLRLNPKPSRILIGLLTAGHLGALLVLVPLDLSILIKMIIAVALVVSWVVAMRKQPGRMNEEGVQSLIWQSDGEWLLQTVAGDELPATLHPSTYVHPWLVVLNFRQEGKPGLLSVVLVPDALDAETFRELRVRLKVAGGVDVSS